MEKIIKNHPMKKWMNGGLYTALLLLAALLLPTSGAVFAAKTLPKSPSACFTPHQDCTRLIVDALDRAKDNIFFQARELSSASIIRALILARQRGVIVKAILDRSQWVKLKHSGSRALVSNGIPVWIDYRPEIANNNVIIIDKHTVISGSFNFSHTAQKQNAETLVIIQNRTLGKKFLSNWELRQRLSKRVLYQYGGNRIEQKASSKKIHQQNGGGRGTLYRIFLQFKN